MKKLELSIIAIFIGITLLAQAPQSFKYQGVARNAEGVAITNSPIGLQFSIIATNVNGSIIYSETFTINSNGNGVFNLNIGEGNVESGNFQIIDWGNDSYFLKVEMDISGGSNYIEMGTSQLLSVPYSLYTSSIYVHYSNDTLYIGDQYVIIDGGGGSPAGTITDYDGNIYETVVIGTQTWMKENLRSLHYADGSTIEDAYAYENNESNVSDYGRLYTWNAVMKIITKSTSNTQGICPNGWHVPTKEEGEICEDFLGGNMIAGGKMKETGYTYWLQPNEGATNESEFSARGSGQRGSTGTYGLINEGFFMWTSTEKDNKANNLGLFHDSDNSAFNQTHPKTMGYSVRCLKD